MHADRTGRATGHLKVVSRAKGLVIYLKWRSPDGHQSQRALGPLWTERGRPPEGAYTRKMAEAELRRVLTDAERGALAAAAKTGATFADAAGEYLRFVEHVRKIDRACVSDYRGVINRYLVPRFGDAQLESISADAIDAYKEELIAEGRLSNRVIVRHLVVLHGIFKRARRVWKLAEENPASPTS